MLGRVIEARRPIFPADGTRSGKHSAFSRAGVYIEALLD